MKQDNLPAERRRRIQELQDNIATLKAEMTRLDRMDNLRWELSEGFPELYSSDYAFFNKMANIVSERRKVLRHRIDYISSSIAVERQKATKKGLGGLQLVAVGPARKG